MPDCSPIEHSFFSNHIRLRCDTPRIKQTRRIKALVKAEEVALKQGQPNHEGVKWKKSKTLELNLPDFQGLFGTAGLSLLHRNGLLETLIERSMVEELASEIEVSDEVKTTLFNGYQHQHSLRSEEAKNEHIEKLKLTNAQFEERVLRPYRISKLAKAQFGPKAEGHFLLTKERLDTIVYSLLRLDSHSLAQELYLKIVNKESNFSDLAGKYSQGPERDTKGVIGPSPLSQSHPHLMEKLRAARPGVLLEPFRIDQWWIVARLEKIAPATFDEQMAGKMSMELFQEWLRQETQNKLEKLNFNDREANKS